MGRWRGNKPHDSSCGVRFMAARPPSPRRSKSASQIIFYKNESPHGHTWGYAGIPYPSFIVKVHHRVVFVLWPPNHLHRSEAQVPPHSVCFRAYATRSHLRQCNPVGAPLAVALAARLPIFPIGK